MKLKTFLLSLGLALSLSASAQSAQNEAVVAVISLNDFHGAFVQAEDQGIPGAPSVLQTIDSLRAAYPHNLVVSAGDNFGGSYFYNTTKGQVMPLFLNECGIRISAAGNHEFDDGLDELGKKWASSPLRPKGWDIKYLCSNVYDQNGRVPDIFEPFTVEEVALSPTKKVRVALVSMLASSAKEQISSRRTKGMRFSGEYRAVLDSVAALPAFEAVRNAEIRALLLHIGSKSKADGTPMWYDKSAGELSAITGPLYQAFLTGHSHDPVCGTINADNKPIVQGWWHGNYINVMKFYVDTLTMAVTRVEPEIVRTPIRPYASLTPKARRLQDVIDSLLVNTKTAAGVPIGTKLTYATRAMEHDRMDKFRISEIGTMLCTSYAQAYRNTYPTRDKDIVLGVSHFGGVRSGISQGEVTVLNVGEVLPFQNNLNGFRVSGKQLKALVDFGYHNPYGYMQRSNLEPVLDADNHVKKLYYISPNGKRRKIKNRSKCVIVADDFMSNGGDGFSTDFFPKENKSADLPLGATDAFIKYLQSLDQIPVE